MDALRAHPVLILDGALQDNLSYLTKLVPRLRGATLAMLRDQYLAALLVGARREALEIAIEEALWQDVEVPSLYLEVVKSAQYEIGRLWQAKRIGVAQEHLATEISRAVLARLHALLPCEPSNGRRVVVACVEGELHDLGAQMVADFLDMAGCTVHFLGADVSPESLAELVRARPPDLLALSATAASHLPAVREAIEYRSRRAVKSSSARLLSACSWASTCTPMTPAAWLPLPGGRSASEVGGRWAEVEPREAPRVKRQRCRGPSRGMRGLGHPSGARGCETSGGVSEGCANFSVSRRSSSRGWPA